jgi:hypothetical protein
MHGQMRKSCPQRNHSQYRMELARGTDEPLLAMTQLRSSLGWIFNDAWRPKDPICDASAT